MALAFTKLLLISVVSVLAAFCARYHE